MIEYFLAAAVVASQPIAVDGDTFKIGKDAFRIANIDAPEISTAECDAEKRLGRVAKARLQQLLLSPKLKIRYGDPDTGRKKDPFKRYLVTLSVGKLDVGNILIEEHLARPWRGRREAWCHSN